MLKCVISGQRYYKGLSKEQISDLKIALRLPNPEYTNLERFSKAPDFVLEKILANVPRILSFWDEPERGVFKVPRGYILPDANEVANVNEPAAEFPPLKITPRDWQEEAIKVIENGIGQPVFDATVQAPPGNGKTIFGVLAMATLGKRTLIIVHKKTILDGWVKDLKLAFGKDFEPAIIKGPKKELGDTVTIAMVQTLRNMDPLDYYDVGLVICDECHHAPASTYLDVIGNTESKYRLGLTATPKRSDGLNDLITWTCGPVRYRAARDTKNTVPVTVNVVKTEMLISSDDVPFTKLINLQSAREDRHELIVGVAACVWQRYKKPILIVTQRVAHSEKLKKLLEQQKISAVAISACMAEDARTATYSRARAGKVPVTLATEKMLAEGTNVPAWTHLILANSFCDETLTKQVVGRVSRGYAGKSRGYVWDLVDDDSFAIALFNKRLRVYNAEKHKIQRVKYKGGKLLLKATTAPAKKPKILRKIRSPHG